MFFEAMPLKRLYDTTCPEGPGGPRGPRREELINEYGYFLLYIWQCVCVCMYGCVHAKVARTVGATELKQPSPTPGLTAVGNQVKNPNS